MRALLVEPNFPIPAKSRNHKNFLPIGLLKIASWLKCNNHEFKLVRHGSQTNDGCNELSFDFKPDKIYITSLFTYWAEYVKEAVQFYKNKFPNSVVIVGGIYASLMPEHCKEFTGCDEVHIGVLKDIDEFNPDYSLVDVDYQIIHASRGCIRNCNCCGAYIIEPEFNYKKSIKNEILKKNLVFYDNNLLANPYIKNILNEIIELRKQKQLSQCESQSGFDGRILLKNPELGELIKKANFKYPRIAWDGNYTEYEEIENQINTLVEAGYRSKEISVFMLYNHDIIFEEMEKKRIKCWDWNVQVSDCRYRPLDQTFDNYNGNKKFQDSNDYYIHANWNNDQIKQFRSNIRKQNICVRQDILYYSADIERKRISKGKASKYKNMNFEEAKRFITDAWNPKDVQSTL